MKGFQNPLLILNVRVNRRYTGRYFHKVFLQVQLFPLPSLPYPLIGYIESDCRCPQLFHQFLLWYSSGLLASTDVTVGLGCEAAYSGLDEVLHKVVLIVQALGFKP